MFKHVSALFKKYHSGRGVSGSRGGVLVGAVVAMVVMGVLGAGMVSMLGTSAFHEVRAKHGEQAYYNAESGFRFAVSVFWEQRDKEAFLEMLKNEVEISLGDPGKFRVKASAEEAGEDRYLEVFSFDDLQIIDEGGDLAIILPEEGRTLPRYWGSFVYKDKLYDYRRYSSSRNMLIGITSSEAAFPAAFDPDEDGELLLGDVMEFLITSTGVSGSGLFKVERVIEDYLDVAMLDHPGWEESYPADMPDDFLEGAGQSLGVFNYDDTEDALLVEQTHSGTHAVAVSAFQPADPTGRIFSPDYEVQVKIKLDKNLFSSAPRDYMAGISFRMNDLQLAQSRGYGVSFVRWDVDHDGTHRRLPHDTLVPEDYLGESSMAGDPFLVLWRTGANSGFQQSGNFQILAWSELPQETPPLKGGEDPEGKLLQDWITLLVRVQEGGENNSSYNRISVMYADQSRFQDSQEASGIQWPPDDLESGGLNVFSPIEWNQVTGGAQSCTDNHHVCDATFMYDARDSVEAGLHVFGNNMNGKVWFGDFAVRCQRTGAEGGMYYLPSYRE